MVDVKISDIPTTETSLDNVAWIEGERGDASAVKVPIGLLRGRELVAASTWRLLLPFGVLNYAPAHTLYCGFGEVQFQDSGGTNLSTGGLAIASGYFDSSWMPAEAFNGNLGTSSGDGWLAPTGIDVSGGHWLGYVHPSAVLPTQVKVWPINNFVTSFPDRFFVQLSRNGVDWDTIGYFATATPAATVGQTFLFSAILT